MDINQLVYMVELKNDINRKRRRFYYWGGDRKRSARSTITNKWYVYQPKSLNHIGKTSAWKGYMAAQTEGKKFMPQLRAACKELGVKLRWGDSGNIQAIYYNGETIEAHKFGRYIINFYTEAFLLGTEVAKSKIKKFTRIEKLLAREE